MEKVHIKPEEPKDKAVEKVLGYIAKLGLAVPEQDTKRPWGAFFVIGEGSQQTFIDTFFPDLDTAQIFEYGKNIQPKVLLVAPGQPLSWQYHHRRAEIWRVIDGPVGVVQSQTDELNEVKPLDSGEIISHGAEVRHRLVGLNGWGVVAEIWQHTDPNQPSNEEDIVRVSDEFNRK